MLWVFGLVLVFFPVGSVGGGGEPDTEQPLLLDAGLWVSIEGAADMAGPAVWGVDLGTSASQSAVACYWPQTGALACMAAFPVEPPLAERGVRDGVAGLYLECHRRGELLTLGGRTVPVPDLLAEALGRFGRPVVVADRWREAELRDALEAAAIPLADLVVRGQRYRDGAEDVRAFRRAFRRACAEGRVTPAPSLLLRSALAEARDDSAATAILAVAEGVRRDAASRPRARRHALAG